MTPKINEILYAGQKTVGCVFRHTVAQQGHEKVYTYLCPDALTPKVGDLGIVEQGGVYSIVTVARVDEESRVDINAPYRYKWVLGFIDPEPYWEHLNDESFTLAEHNMNVPTRV